MTEPEIQFTERLSRRNLRRAVILVGAILAIVVGAAVTMGASPSTSPATPGATAQPGASGDPGTPDNGPWKGLGRGDVGGPGRFGPITITSISGSNLGLETEDGWTRTIAITSATAITKDGETIAASDLAVGDEIRLRQSRASDGTFTITAIDVVQPKIGGTVTSVTADSITVTGRDGASHTITTTNATTYRLGRRRGEPIGRRRRLEDRRGGLRGHGRFLHGDDGDDQGGTCRRDGHRRDRLDHHDPAARWIEPHDQRRRRHDVRRCRQQGSGSWRRHRRDAAHRRGPTERRRFVRRDRDPGRQRPIPRREARPGRRRPAESVGEPVHDRLRNPPGHAQRKPATMSPVFIISHGLLRPTCSPEVIHRGASTARQPTPRRQLQ